MTIPCNSFRLTAIGVIWLSTMLPARSAEQPVNVYVLSVQSNMVGIGQVTGGGSRWGAEFIDPVVSVYAGKYDPTADYDKRNPTKTLKLEQFGGVKSTPYRGGGTQVTRGFLQPKTTGVYELRPGYGGPTYLKNYADGWDAEAGLRRYFEFYCERRIHQSLGDATPSSVFGAKR